MVKMLMIMYNIALCTSYITHFNVAHFLHIRVDHVEQELEIKKEHVQEVGWSTSDKLRGY
jgi:hypothetical protein